MIDVPVHDTKKPLLTVGIAITTRDRWADLERTLDRVRDFPGLRECPIIVSDDGSSEPCPPALAARFPEVQFRRSDPPLGYITQRNQLAQWLETDYVLSLDDDAYPVAGDVRAAVEYLARHPDVLCLALNLVGLPDETPELPLDATPFSSRLFIGCGHLMDRRKFLELGGYRRELQFYNEEWEISARATHRKWKVVCYPGLLVCHHRSMANRKVGSRAYYFARSKTLFALWMVPLRLLPIALALAVTGTVQNWGIRSGVSILLGCARGAVDWAGSLWRLRQPLTMDAFRGWRALPWPPSR